MRKKFFYHFTGTVFNFRLSCSKIHFSFHWMRSPLKYDDGELKILIVTQQLTRAWAAKNRAKSADYSQINRAAQWGSVRGARAMQNLWNHWTVPKYRRSGGRRNKINQYQCELHNSRKLLFVIVWTREGVAAIVLAIAEVRSTPSCKWIMGLQVHDVKKIYNLFEQYTIVFYRRPGHHRSHSADGPMSVDSTLRSLISGVENRLINGVSPMHCSLHEARVQRVNKSSRVLLLLPSRFDSAHFRRLDTTRFDAHRAVNT
jgi:hypothetical protein